MDSQVSEQLEAYEDFLDLDVVAEEIEAAKQAENVTPRYVRGILAAIVAENGAVSYETLAERLSLSSTRHVSTAATELERRKITIKDKRDRDSIVDRNVDGIQEIRQATTDREKIEQLMDRF